MNLDTEPYARQAARRLQAGDWGRLLTPHGGVCPVGAAPAAPIGMAVAGGVETPGTRHTPGTWGKRHE